jgi:hypothetical protein
MLFLGKENLKVLPYEDVASFYEEYLCHCTNQSPPLSKKFIAGREVFRTTFNELNESETIRLAGCKGGFQTCEICNTAHDLLRDTGNYRKSYI